MSVLKDRHALSLNQNCEVSSAEIVAPDCKNNKHYVHNS